jgi:16S rRNA (uracil1498-N3)-methyltransferase
MAHRFFLAGPLPNVPGEPLPLSLDDAHHAVRVLRVRPGELIEVVEPTGGALRAEVVSADDAGVVATVLGPVEVESWALPNVTLFQGVAKGDKMDDIVRQAVEVGAEAIVPVMTARTIVRLDADKRLARGERWQRIAKSAAEQAKRASVPRVAAPVSLAEALGLLSGYDRTVVLWEDSCDAGLAETLADLRDQADARVALVVGPEGGLGAEEVSLLRERGAVVATLGPSVMRTETAAVVALALAIAALGGMGGAK